MKVHYGTTKAHCQTASTYALQLTSDREKVTCLRCNASRKCRQCKKNLPIGEFASYLKFGEPMRRTTCHRCRTGTDRGDSNFKGLGKLCCTICSKPYRDHRIGPCPEWDSAA